MTRPHHPAPRDVVLAVDIGGTTVKGAVFDRFGEVIARETTRTFAISGDAYASVLDLATSLYSTAVDAGFAPVGIGLASPGLVDPASGTVLFAGNLGWDDLPLRERLESAFLIPVHVGHDARMAAIAERAARASRGTDENSAGTSLDNAIVIPIGTGVSAAVVTSGMLVEGATGAAGELGHMPVIPHGELCVCGQHGCIEAYASGVTILSRYRQRGGTLASSTQAVASSIDTDPIAAEVWADAINALAIGITALTAVLDPAVIVVGGGVSAAGDALLVPLREQVEARLGWRSTPRIEQSVLVAQGGLIGAALIGWTDNEIDSGFALTAYRSLSTERTPVAADGTAHD